MKCPKCGKECQDFDNFCFSCGFKLKKPDNVNSEEPSLENEEPAKKNEEPAKKNEDATTESEEATADQKRHSKVGLLVVVIAVILISFVVFGVKSFRETSNSNSVKETEPEETEPEEIGLEEIESEGTESEVIESEEETRSIQSEAKEHRYEYVISDYSWTQALEDAKQKGGYLVNINNKEEFDVIVSEISVLGYDDIFFRIGGRRDQDDEQYYWADAENHLSGAPLNDKNSWCHYAWASGEPSYKWKDIDEMCMEMYQKEGKWIWNDAPDDKIAVVPNYAGKQGYIIEFEE